MKSHDVHLDALEVAMGVKFKNRNGVASALKALSGCGMDDESGDGEGSSDNGKSQDQGKGQGKGLLAQALANVK